MDTVKSEKKISLIKKLFSDPLLRPIEVFGTIIGLLLVCYSFYQSNRLTWLNSINTHSSELSKMEIENGFITCLYESDASIIVQDKINKSDITCKEIYKTLNIKKATLYLEENLDFFIDIIRYDKEYSLNNENEFIIYYQEWFNDLHGKDNNISKKFRTKTITKKIKYINTYIKNSGKKPWYNCYYKNIKNYIHNFLST